MYNLGPGNRKTITISLRVHLS